MSERDQELEEGNPSYGATASAVAREIEDILGVQENGAWNVSPFRWRGRIEQALRKLAQSED